MVDAEDQHPGHRGSRGQDHHGRVVNTWTPQLYRLFGIINSNLLSVFDPSREAPEIKDSDNMDIFLKLNCFALFGCYQKYRKIKTCMTVMRKTVMLSMVEMPRVIFSPDSAGMRNTNLLLNLLSFFFIWWMVFLMLQEGVTSPGIVIWCYVRLGPVKDATFWHYLSLFDI